MGMEYCCAARSENMGLAQLKLLCLLWPSMKFEAFLQPKEPASNRSGSSIGRRAISIRERLLRLEEGPRFCRAEW